MLGTREESWEKLGLAGLEPEPVPHSLSIRAVPSIRPVQGARPKGGGGIKGVRDMLQKRITPACPAVSAGTRLAFRSDQRRSLWRTQGWPPDWIGVCSGPSSLRYQYYHSTARDN